MHPRAGEIVLLGDDHVARGYWADWQPVAVNRGVAGDTTQELLARVQDSILESEAVIVHAGLNDLRMGQWSRSTDTAVLCMDTVIRHIRRASPSSKILLHGVPPSVERLRGRAAELNMRYREMVRRHGIDFVDLWPEFADDRGRLRREFAKSSWHLNIEGYRRWQQVLAEYLPEDSHEGGRDART